MNPSKESLNMPGAEEFRPDEDCATDEAFGGDPDGRCALVDEERCTLRCHLLHQEGEAQLNDHLFDGKAGDSR